MNADISLLQHQAAQAVPLWRKRKPGPVGRWSPLWPVYAELRRKGFTIREAIDWLIREGAVPAKDRQKAEYGLPMVDSRRRREEARASGGKPPPAPPHDEKSLAKAATDAVSVPTSTSCAGSRLRRSTTAARALVRQDA
jgi:hypothetical protein